MTTKSNKVYKTKPLENLTIDIEEDGTSRTVPALSSYFVTPRPPIQFTAPPKKNRHGQFLYGTKEDWLCKMVIYKSNLEWLLSLPHNRFWSQVVYGNDTWDSVISFLQEGYPFYCIDNLTEDEDIQETYYIIMNLVFKIFARITTQKESKENWIGDKKYGSLLYNYTILSVPIFLDLCVIFDVFNSEEVKRMIVNSFEAQPLYKEDFNNSVQHIKAIFSSLEDQFSNNTAGGVTKLSDKKLQVKDMTVANVQDMVFYSLDISVTLSTFVEHYIEGANVLHAHRFEVNVASFYENVITALCRRIQLICDKEGNMDIYFTLMFKLNQARYFLIKLFHQCIQSPLSSIERNDGDVVSKDYADNYLDILTECITFKTFIKDYQNKYPIDHDLELLWNKCSELDSMKYNFIIECILMCSSPKDKKSEPKLDSYNNKKSINQTKQINASASTSSSVKKIEVQGVELESLVTEVKDILPHLGDGFVKCCLEFYNYSSSSVINAILENNLPDCLSSLNHTLPNDPSKNHAFPELSAKLNQDIIPYIPPEKGNPYFPERVNVFDNDEFDIMTRDRVDTSRIFKGKRNDSKQRDLKDVIDDKSFREEFRNKFSLLGLIEEADIYDDEYDDTYDESEVPVPEAGEPLFQKFVTPRVLELAQRKENSKSGAPNEEFFEDEEDDDEEESNLERGRSVSFVENPELVRARYEDQRMRKFKPWQREQQPSRNVVGNPKGQGQEKDVQVNRSKKNVNKSFHGNHNRKRGALHKRFQGM